MLLTRSVCASLGLAANEGMVITVWPDADSAIRYGHLITEVPNVRVSRTEAIMEPTVRFAIWLCLDGLPIQEVEWKSNSQSVLGQLPQLHRKKKEYTLIGILR